MDQGEIRGDNRILIDSAIYTKDDELAPEYTQDHAQPKFAYSPRVSWMISEDW
jgi:hypothetical protein